MAPMSKMSVMEQDKEMSVPGLGFFVNGVFAEIGGERFRGDVFSMSCRSCGFEEVFFVVEPDFWPRCPCCDNRELRPSLNKARTWAANELGGDISC